MITGLNPTLETRTALLKELKADAQLAALIGPRIYPPQTPSTLTWPFVRMGIATANPLLFDGCDGADVAGTVHCFTKKDSSTDPEAAAHAICSHIVRILNGIDNLQIDADAAMSVHIRQTQVIQDAAEAGAFHGIVTYEARSL